MFKYRFDKNCIPYPKAIVILRFLLNKRETQVLANNFFGVKLSAEADYKFYTALFQTTKIQILKAIHNGLDVGDRPVEVVSDYKDTNF